MKQSILVIALLVAIAVMASTAAMAVPATPTISWPTAGNIVQSDRPDIRWDATGYDAYEVHICTTNDPNNPNAWDSGQVYAADGVTMSGALTPLATYYVFLRLHDASGWSNWSAYGDSFYVDGQLMNDPYMIGGGAGRVTNSLCYNPDRNEYLISYWNNAVGGDDSVISYYRLDGNGAMIGSEVIVSDTLTGAAASKVVYNSVRKEYLIAYVGYTAAGGLHSEVRTQRVDAATGSLIGSSNYVASGSGAIEITAAYGSVSNNYLLVWDGGYDGPNRLCAQRFDGTAVAQGSIFLVDNGSYSAASNPAVCYNSTANEFFVTMETYVDSVTWWNNYFQRIRASDGVFQGGNVNIAYTLDWDCDTRPAYDSNMNRYLVICAGGSPSPWAQFISATGSLIGPRIPVADPYYDGGMTAIAWNPVSREYLLTWAHGASASLWGRRMSQTGAFIGEVMRFNGDVTGFGNWDPHPVANSSTGEYLVAWYWQYANLYVRRYKPLTPPAYAPGPVLNFQANSGNGVVNLTWTNPIGSIYTGTMIRYRTDTYPTSATDGTLAVDKSGTAGANDSYTHTGRTNGVVYYYTAFAHDSTPLYAAGRSWWAAPTAPTCLSDNFSYSDGALNGNGGWSGTATSSQIAITGQTIKIQAGSGVVTAVRTTLCGDPGQGYMWVDLKIKGGQGWSQMYNVWIDDTAGHNMARWYGAGYTARGRIGSTASTTATQTLTGNWDDLAVKINPYANTTEFFFNGVSLGVLDHGQTGAGDVIGAIRFERTESGGYASDYVYFDGLLIGQSGSDTTPPAPVSNFAAIAGNGQNSLSWTNPTSDFAGTKIMFKTTGFPTGPTDGTQVYNGTGTNTIHTGLTNGTTYYYCAYSYDAVPNYASAAQASAAPAPATSCYTDAFSYSDGTLNGNGGWSGSATSSHISITSQTVKIAGGTTGYDAIHTTNCGDPGQGFMWVHVKVKSGSGSSYIWGLWIDDTNSQNMARWYGSGTTARGRISGTASVTSVQTLTGGWDDLGVKINPYNKTSEFFFNGASLGALDYSQSTSGTVIGRLRFERMNSSGCDADYANFDSMIIGSYDSTPPAPVTNFTTTAGDGSATLSWVNPTDSDWAGTMIRYKTTGYPTGPADGSLSYNGTGTGYTSTGLPNGVTYYCSAYAYDTSMNYSTQVNASVTPNDTVAPGNVTSFTATRGDMQNSLSWMNPGDTDFAGVKIMFKTTGYPTGPTDGTQCYSGTGASYLHTGLTNGATYYYKAFSFDEMPNYSSGAQTSAIPADVTAPGNVTSFTATSGDTSNDLFWTNPGDADLAGVKIMFKTTGYPTGPTDGTQCYSGMGTSYTHNGLTNGTTYYYKAFSFDEVPNYASGAQASAVPADVIAPGNVTAFTATAGDTQNVLAWTKPGDADLAGVKIMFKTTGYPTGPADGTQCYSGTGTTYTHTGLTNGTTYYYKAFSFDEVPNYSSGTQVSAVPSAAYCFRDQFTYSDGALNGNGGWTGSATSSQIAISGSTVKILSGATSYDAVKTVSCGTGSLTYIMVRCKIQKGSGLNNIWNLWINDSTGANFARWYGTGSTAIGRISGSGLITAGQTLTGVGTWDNIDVKIVPSALTAEFFFNGTSLGALSYSGYASGSSVVQLRFERQNNNVSGEYVFLDDIRVGGN